MLTATAAGMIAVGAAWGFRTKDELVENGASAVLDHPLGVARTARVTPARPLRGRRPPASARYVSAPDSRSSARKRRHQRGVCRHDGGPVPVRRAREGHLGAGLSRDDGAGGVVPRREVELPVRVHVAGGDVAEIEGRRPAAADVAHAAQHLGHDGALTLALSRLVREAGGHQGRREIGLLAHADRLVVADAPRTR